MQAIDISSRGGPDWIYRSKTRINTIEKIQHTTILEINVNRHKYDKQWHTKTDQSKYNDRKLITGKVQRRTRNLLRKINRQ